MFAVACSSPRWSKSPSSAGLLFGTVRRRGRLAAYAVSVLLFCFYHVWQYVLLDWRYLLQMINYNSRLRRAVLQL